MLGELSDISWDVVCFSETRLPSQDIILVGGHRLISSLGTFVHAGVAILIHQRWVQSVTSFSRVSDRLLLVDLTMHERLYRIQSIYIPHAGYHVNDFNICFDDLRKSVLEGQQIGRKCFIGGDFNAEMYRGWRGNRLREFIAEVSLVNSAENFPQGIEESWTFRSCLGDIRILDYCLVPTEITIETSRSIDGLNLGSDHRAVQCCVLLPCCSKARLKRRGKP